MSFQEINASLQIISADVMASLLFRCHVPVRSFRRLAYGIFIWTFLCYGVFRLTQHDVAVTYLSGRILRGLLQKLVEHVNPDGASSTTPSNLLDLEPQVDRSPSLNEQQILQQLNNSNLPLAYWAHTKVKQNPKSCVFFPSLYDLDFNNIYWQQLMSPNGTFYLYGAYYDDRWRGSRNPSVRVLAMVDRIKPPPTVCQFWFDSGTSPIFAAASFTHGWISKRGNYKDGILQPFLVNCRVPKSESGGRIPASVSLVRNRCDKPTTNLLVTNQRPAVKENFAVCVKGLDFLHEDLSVRLVEWLELLKILGANKIFLYELEVHPNISKVLQYYRDLGLVELTPVTLPGNQPNLPGFRHLYLKSKLTTKRQNEVIHYNDCLYRNLYNYRFVSVPKV